MDKKKLRVKSLDLKPLLRIGKKGVNDSIFSEIKTLLKKHELVKIKILNNCQEEKTKVIANVIEETKSDIVSIKGNTFVIFLKKG